MSRRRQFSETHTPLLSVGAFPPEEVSDCVEKKKEADTIKSLLWILLSVPKSFLEPYNNKARLMAQKKK